MTDKLVGVLLRFCEGPFALMADIEAMYHQIKVHPDEVDALRSLWYPDSDLRTFAPKSSYGEIFFISRLELVDKVLTPKMRKKMGVTDFVSEKMAVEKCLNFDKLVIITRCSLLR